MLVSLSDVLVDRCHCLVIVENEANLSPESIMSGYYYQDMNGYNGMPQKQQQQQQQQYGGGGYSQQNSIDDYMVPEEEWEREAVLDPAWERQQKKVIECARATTDTLHCSIVA